MWLTIRAWGTKHKSIIVGALLTASFVVLSALTTLDASAFREPLVWAGALTIATIRQVAAYVLSKLPSA